MIDKTQHKRPRSALRASRRNARETASIIGHRTSSGILNQGVDVLVRRDYSPVLRQAELPTVTVTWRGNLRLSSQFA